MFLTMDLGLQIEDFIFKIWD